MEALICFLFVLHSLAVVTYVNVPVYSSENT